MEEKLKELYEKLKLESKTEYDHKLPKIIIKNHIFGLMIHEKFEFEDEIYSIRRNKNDILNLEVYIKDKVIKISGEIFD